MIGANRKTLVMTLGILAGRAVSEMFLLKAGPEDPKGFVMMREGLGLDDLVSALAGVAMVALADRVVPKG